MPAKGKKNAPQVAATPVTAEPVVEAKADTPDVAAPAKEKKPRAEPKLVPADTSLSETRIRRHVIKYMNPETAKAANQLKVPKVKEGDTVKEVSKKYGELSDSTVLLILQHKPEAPAEDAKPEAKAQYELRMSLYRALQAPRASWADRQLTTAEAKELRRMVKEGTIRTGDDAIGAFTATANFIVREVATLGLKQVASDEKKVMKLPHVVSGLSSLSSWPLLQNLKCVAAAQKAVEDHRQEKLRKEQEKKDLQKKKKADKAAGVAPAAEPLAAPVVAVAQAADAPKGEKNPWADFVHHSSNLIRVVSQETGTKCEISAPVKEFCARVVYELVCMYGDLIQCQTNYAGVKTIKGATITSITTFIFMYTRTSAPGLTEYVSAYLAKLAAEAAVAKAAKKAAEDAKKTAAPVADAPAQPAA